MARVPTDISDKPRIPVVITASGLLEKESNRLLDKDELNNISLANGLSDKFHKRLSELSSLN